MSSDLFRREVLEARRQSWLGQVQASQPLSIRIAAWFTLVLVVLAILYTIWGVYTRRVHATGLMVPPSGLITVNANTTGTIAQQNAIEGHHVKKGDVLFTIDLEATSSSGPTQEHILSQLRHQRDLLQQQKNIRTQDAPVEKQSMVTQIRYLNQQHQHIGHQLDNDAHVLPVVEAAVRRMQTAQSAHLVTETQFQSQLYTYAQLLSSHAQFLQSYTDTEGKIADLTTKLIRYDGQLAHDLNDLDKQIAQIDQQIAESEGHRSSIILAPDDGTLTAIRVNPGQQVSSGTPLLTLLPTGHALEAELYVSSASIGFLHEGEPVLLRYAAFPYQRFGLYRGHVSEITRAPVTATDGTGQKAAPSDKDKTQSQNPGQDIYRIRVRPDQQFVDAYGQHKPLEAGMEVEADIAIDTRRLYQWIFDPVISMRDDFYAVSGGLR
ncbi:HlyD family secretion protein [Acetobacter oryzoeni]|uniref:HlyD family efflux transporter periplasmic adaptor subunit n=1 Tax=Acetobacter oryzoeni TaxID=2500548 RepID=A0A5B9GGA1_9PROT|nr:HlyD family efflux transporter periplasmic adaptor subunit [Acetobacter oryzoeni]MCP1202730.1 HlyD family efflux transporter periplasmic adaptor subunit [Acetobacter oryzoeni]QEE84509.1 HlyD family efflux transporter periplasmic adaptor subunit [Acetobacter oryzoeni]